jgi:hypothetical protein
LEVNEAIEHLITWSVILGALDLATGCIINDLTTIILAAAARRKCNLSYLDVNSFYLLHAQLG